MNTKTSDSFALPLMSSGCAAFGVNALLHTGVVPSWELGAISLLSAFGYGFAASYQILTRRCINMLEDVLNKYGA